MANKQFWQICYKCSCYLQCKTYTIPGEHCYKIIDALKLVVGVKNSESRLKIIKKELKPIGIRYKYFHSNNYGGDCVTSIKFNYVKYSLMDIVGCGQSIYIEQMNARSVTVIEIANG